MGFLGLQHGRKAENGLPAPESCTICQVNKRIIWAILWVLLAASCSGSGGSGNPWPPSSPRQPDRLQLVAPDESDSLAWWRENILVGLANSGEQDEQQQQYVQSLLEETNRIRLANGVAPVELNASLCSVAQAHALDQATRDYWAHKTPEGLSSRKRIEAATGLVVAAGGENSSIGLTGLETAESMVRGWASHSGHRELLLNPDVQYMGGGWAQYSGGEPLFVTQLLVSFADE